MSRIKALAGQTIIYGVSTVLVRALNWLLAPYHSQVFKNTPEDYGLISELYAYVAFINVIFMYGMETAFFRYAASQPDKKNEVFSTAFISLLASTLSLGTLLILFAPYIAEYLQYPGKGSLVAIVVLIIGFDTLSNIPFAKLRLEGKSLKYVAIKGFNVILNILLNLFFLLPIIKGTPAMFGFEVDPNKAVFYVFLSNLIASAATFLVFTPEILGLKLKFDISLWRQMFKYGWPLLLVGLAGMVNETIDRILLKSLLPQANLQERLAQVGFYSMAYKLSIFMNLVVQGFRLGAEPFFFKRAKDKDAKEVYSSVMTYFVIFALLVFLGVSLNLHWIQLILSEPYRVAIDIVPVLLLAYLFLGVFYNASVWYKLTDNTKLAIYLTLFGAMITVLVNVLLIPVIGYWASAIATFSAYLGMTVFSLAWGKRYFQVPYNYKKLLAYIGFALILFAIGYFLPLESGTLKTLIGNALIFLFLVTAWQIDLKQLVGTSN